jgi:hypothetical protein
MVLLVREPACSIGLARNVKSGRGARRAHPSPAREDRLYAVVRDHLDGFLRAAREHGALPAFIGRAFRAFRG